jgi:glycosyltransferase involved in cell wall biosynthesis
MVPPQAIVFGNTAGRDVHAKGLGMDLSLSPVIRLLVDVDKYRYKSRSFLRRKKIVSIGRIVDFKTYNFTMLPVVRELVETGYEIEWHVYGDGPQFSEFVRDIEKLSLQKHVFAHGAIPYSKFESVLDDAFIFIGSGTSLIEAAACGVPSLTTIEYSEGPDSYGFICEVDGFNLIEPGLNKKVYALQERIKFLLACSNEEYFEIQERCRAKARVYSGECVVNDYVETFNTAKNSGVGVFISDWKMVVSFFNALVIKIGGAR